MTRDIWTIGHSTQPIEAFLDALASFEVRLIVDIRRFPHSRRHPHFNTDNLKKSLFQRGITYEWLGTELGGFRKTSAASPHVGIQHSNFRGYADHMETPNFRKGVDKLVAWTSQARVAYMCSESNFKSCHRRLLSDYLQLVLGFNIHHIVKTGRELPHDPFKEARVVDGKLLYAAKPLEDFGPA